MGFQARQRTADPRLACIPVCRPIKVNSTLSMDPGCRMPGRWYLSTPALQVCNHSSLGHCRHVPGSTLPTMAVTCFELFGDDGRPCHVATLCRIAYEFLRHAFGCTHKLRLLGWRQRQAIDDKFAVILDSHPSRLRTDMR